MKKIFKLIAAVLLTATTWAQSPEKMSYQAVVRDAGNALVTSQSVGMQISILQGSVSGSAVYVETQTPSTNINGLISIEIGSGTVVSGAFNIIDWSAGPYFIKTETDPTGGASYTITGTSQLMSVPYALHAKTADSIAGGIIITEIDPVFSSHLSSSITSLDTTNWGNHTIDTDTHIDSLGISQLGFITGMSSETDPVFSSHLASAITSADTTNWGNHTIDTDTQLDSSDIANMGFISGSITPSIEYKKIFMANSNNYMANLSWIQIYSNGVNGELEVTVPNTASASVRVSYSIDNVTPVASTVAVGNSIIIAGLSSARLEITCVEYSNTGPGGILNWTGIGTANGWQIGHVMYEE